MGRLHNLIGAVIAAALATPAAAQNFDNGVQPRPPEARIQVGVVIPFGGGGTDAERAPRLEAWSDRPAQRQLPAATLGNDFDRPTVRPVRIGFNFSGPTRLMLNGREIPGQDNRKGISALGWVGIGVGVAVVVFGVVALDAFNKDNGL